VEHFADARRSRDLQRVACSGERRGVRCEHRVTNQNTLVAIVFSTGKNGSLGASGASEARNLDGNALFVSRPPDPASAAGGEFDDLVTWIPVALLYGRMISAGVLP
jgi:hypothetical protein